MTRLTYSTLIVSLALCLGACAGGNNDTHKEQLTGVYTFRPEANTDISTTSHTSTVEEGRSVNASFKTGGQIRHLSVSEGDYVSKGQILARLDDVDYKLQLQQLETQYNQVSSEIKRIEEMYRHNSVSQNDYEKAVAGLRQLKIQLDMVKNQLAYTQLTAPVAGHIVEVYMEEGEMVGAGTPVFKIVDDASLEATVALSPKAYAQKDRIVRCLGSSAVTGDTAIPLDIISFIPDADNNALFKLRLKVPDAYRKRLLPGMNLNVDIYYQSDSADGLCRIPSRALFERDGHTFVWAVTDSVLSAREVTVAGAPQDSYSMVRGLDGNEEIVAVGVHHLSDNQKVKVIGNIDKLRD